jgi:hypothetical protein
MLLRVSGTATGNEVDLASVMGKDVGDGGVAHGRLLVSFVEAVMGEDDARLTERREAVLKQLGAEGLVDAAAVIAGFNAVDRIADATGIPLDEDMEAPTAPMRSEMGLDRFAPASKG